MIPKGRLRGRANPRLQHERRRGIAAACLVAATLAIGGCSATNSLPAAYTPEHAEVKLPDLDEVQVVRDKVSRADFAVSQRSAALAALSVDCGTCATALKASEDHALARLELSGGLWEPWGDLASEDDASTYVAFPPDVVEAPYTVLGLVEFMTHSAAQQLVDIGSLDANFSEEKSALAGIVVGRLGAAQELGLAFNLAPVFVEVREGAGGEAYAPDLEVPQSRGSEQEDSVPAYTGLSAPSPASRLFVDPALLPAQVAADEDLSEDDASRLAALVSDLDCVRSSALALPEDQWETAEKLHFASLLEKHNDDYLRLGGPDERSLRCVSDLGNAQDLVQHAVTQQVRLLVEGPASAAGVAARAIVEDMVAWRQVSPKTLPAEGLWPSQVPPGGGE